MIKSLKIWAVLLTALIVGAIPSTATKPSSQEKLEIIREVVRGFSDGLNDSALSAKIAQLDSVKLVYATVSSDSDSAMTAENVAKIEEAKAVLEALRDDDNYNDRSFPGERIIGDGINWVGTLVILSSVLMFATPILVVFLICFFIYRTKRSRDKVMLKSLETGQKLPESYLNTHKSANRLHTGIKQIAWGVAIMIFFFSVDAQPVAGLMIVLVIIGAGNLLTFFLYDRKEINRRNDASGIECEIIETDVTVNHKEYNTKDVESSSSPQFPPIPGSDNCNNDVK